MSRAPTRSPMTIKPDCPYRWADLPWLALTAVVLALLDRIVVDFFAANGMATIFRPGAGVALAALLIGGRKVWPAILLGTLAGGLWAGQAPGVAGLMAFGSLAEALLGAWLLTRTADFDTALGTSRDFVRLCGLAGALSPLLCALTCADTLLLAGQIAPDEAWREFVQHWMGDLLGIVIVAPLILVWRQLPARQQIAWPEGLALIATSFLVGQIVFLDWFHSLFGLINQGYWMYLIVSWAAVRLGMHGVLAVLLMATLQALAGAAAGLGFFGDDLVMTQLSNLWAYMLTLALVGIALAIIFAERGRISAELGKLSLAVAQSPVSIIITDLNGRIEYVNPAFTVVSGYATDEILGQTPRLLQSGRTPPETYQALWRTLQTGKVWEGEFINRRKDGSDYVESATISPLRQDDGEVSHYVAVKADITERQRMIGELRASEESLRLAKNAAGLGIYDCNLVAGSLDCDERTRQLWGIAPGAALTRASLLATVHANDRPAAASAIERALDPQGSGEYAAEYRVIDPADGIRHVMTHGQVFFAAGRAVRLVGTVQDISARKQLEREVQERRSEMEGLVNQQVAAQTAAAIAHELNQPLVSVSAYSEAALRMLRAGNKQPEKLARALEGSMEQAQRAGRTLHELLDFLHKGEVIAEPVDLVGVVRDALAIAEASGYGGFQAEVEVEPGVSAVLANRLQLQKVVLNLLHNGVEAMRSAGLPEAAIRIKVHSLAGTNMVQVTVQDSGPGLPAATAHRVFEPFFTTKPTGVGLGLAISRALIETHGGQLWADPEAGSGATFHFMLPVA